MRVFGFYSPPHSRSFNITKRTPKLKLYIYYTNCHSFVRNFRPKGQMSDNLCNIGQVVENLGQMSDNLCNIGQVAENVGQMSDNLCNI